MRRCVRYLEIQQSHGKEGNARFANEGHLHFVSVVFGFHCGRWKARYVSAFVMSFLKAVVSIVIAFEVQVQGFPNNFSSGRPLDSFNLGLRVQN